jgi:1,2-phenylacetyl-CoA epoxidase catalytic subunit
MWAARLRAEPRFTAAVEELWPFALGMLDPGLRSELARRAGRASNSLLQAHDSSHLPERGAHLPELAELLAEMTEVRRSEPGAQW